MTHNFFAVNFTHLPVPVWYGKLCDYREKTSKEECQKYSNKERAAISNFVSEHDIASVVRRHTHYKLKESNNKD